MKLSSNLARRVIHLVLNKAGVPIFVVLFLTFPPSIFDCLQYMKQMMAS